MKIENWMIAFALEVIGFILTMTIVIFHGDSTESVHRILGFFGLTLIFMGGLIAMTGIWGD